MINDIVLGLSEEEQMQLVEEMRIFKDLSVFNRILEDYCMHKMSAFCGEETHKTAHITGKQDVCNFIKEIQSYKLRKV